MRVWMPALAYPTFKRFAGRRFTIWSAYFDGGWAKVDVRRRDAR